MVLLVGSYLREIPGKHLISKLKIGPYGPELLWHLG